MRSIKRPYRQCVGCRRILRKEELLRFVSMNTQELIFDSKESLPGRGAYLCPDQDCFIKARSKKAFQKALGESIIREDLVGEVLTSMVGILLNELSISKKGGYLKEGVQFLGSIEEGDIVIITGDISENHANKISEIRKTPGAKVFFAPVQAYSDHRIPDAYCLSNNPGTLDIARTVTKICKLSLRRV